jgi:5-(carboxyamino)imidazole ribonucleotide synthase
MVNIIGSMPTELEALRTSGFHVHDYGKAERLGRKLGHITCVSQSAIGRDQQMEEIRRIMSN